MISDYIFYIMTGILVVFGMNYITELLKINNNGFKIVVYAVFISIYFMIYLKHRKNQSERLDEEIRNIENKYIERTVNRNNKNND
jgi:hypothetical protein